jgi:hypothetical protein
MKRNPLIRRISEQQWDALVLKFRDASYRQCSSYASAAARHVGAVSELNCLMEERGLMGLAEVRVKPIPMTAFGLAYASYAPIVMLEDTFDERQFGKCLDLLVEEYVERRGLLLRIAPALIDGGSFQDAQISCLKDRGFHPASTQSARQTFVLDIRRPLEEIRRDFDAKWRSDLVKSEKADLRITRSVNPNDFDQFEQIFLELTKKKGFMPHQDVRFFKHVQSGASPDQKLVLHLAWQGDELLAGHLGSFMGRTAVYLLGASTSKGRDLRAAYLLQWKAIQHAKDTGNFFYDLGGIDQQKNPDVYRFKRRLNGRFVTELGAYELAPGRVSHCVIQLAEKARNFLRRGSQNG